MSYSQQSIEQYALKLLGMGYGVDYMFDAVQRAVHVNIRKGKLAISKMIPEGENVILWMEDMCRELDRDERGELDLMRDELNKYKAAVKQLSFDLEMANTSPRAVATEADVRKKTLEMAAEFLMDYGAIKTGTELESVCEQIRKLHPSKAMVMAEAAKKMSAGWTQYDPK